MNYSSLLAQVWGLTIAVVSLAMLVKPRLLKRLFSVAENKFIMYIWGITTLAVGMAMVFMHNLWVLDWRVVITIIGWLTLIKGLDLLLLPKRMKKRWIKMESHQWKEIYLFLFLGGLILTYLGFTR